MHSKCLAKKLQSTVHIQRLIQMYKYQSQILIYENKEKQKRKNKIKEETLSNPIGNTNL